MNLEAANLVQGAASLSLGAIVGLCLWHWRSLREKARIEASEKDILANARQEAESLIREARQTAAEEAEQKVQQTTAECTARKQEIAELERRLTERDKLINRQLEGLVQQENNLIEKQAALQLKTRDLESSQAELARQNQLRREQLLHLAHLSESKARETILKEIEQETLKDAADLARHILENARSNAENEARRIISTAIQRYAGEHAFENSTAAITLPNEEIKGRIIGREGRNIRAFEAATGVTVLIDDTPNAVVLSSFDPVRRQIAHESMQRLILDGRIHPARIEEIVARVSQEMEEAILKAGEEAVFKVGIPPLPLELLKLVGRLKFRRSYSQNILDHSVEVAHLSGLMAAELGLDIAIAKRSGLLHDIGKAVNHEIEGAHAIIGADIVKRCGESDIVVNCVAAHHGEVPPASAFAFIVSAADAISASRPGARSENISTYIKRLEQLEKIGASFPGVERCFAVQAGRELRVMVQPDNVNDEQAFALARSIARKIEEELQYPGQIRITVVRETRCIEYAK
jgi:ribonuclease Y